MMTASRWNALLVALFASWALLACGAETESTPAPTSSASDVAAKGELDFSGMYEVSGLTVETASGNQREISGTIILAQDKGEYTSTFNLKTVLPSPDGPLHTDVIGKGEGVVDGTTLRGSARTQLVMSRVPGMDTAFAFAPRAVGARIVSTSVARLEDDGKLSIEIETKPEPGEEYPPTRTTLRGSYVPIQSR
ncbi:MAG: hypothetical protein GY946_28120 [bacterium]|nr:hypothetical protein [bacterium]